MNGRKVARWNCTQRAAQLVFLRVIERHHVLVVGPVADVRIYEKIRVQLMKNGGEATGVAGVGFNKIAVQVVVAGIAAKAVLFGPILIDARRAIAVQRATDVVKRDDSQHHAVELGKALGVQGHVAQQQHRGIDAVGLAGMDGIVDEQDRFALRFQLGDVELAVAGVEYQMQGLAAVRRALGLHLNLGKIPGQSLVVGDSLVVGWGLGTLALFETRFVLSVGTGTT